MLLLVYVNEQILSSFFYNAKLNFYTMTGILIINCLTYLLVRFLVENSMCTIYHKTKISLLQFLTHHLANTGIKMQLHQIIHFSSLFIYILPFEILIESITFLSFGMHIASWACDLTGKYLTMKHDKFASKGFLQQTLSERGKRGCVNYAFFKFELFIFVSKQLLCTATGMFRVE